MKKSIALFRVDATSRTGMGHFVRCLNLAKVLLSKMRDVSIVFFGDFPGNLIVQHRTKRLQFVSVRLPRAGALCRDQMARQIKDKEPKYLFIDLPFLTQQDLDDVRLWALYVICIDDLASADLEPDFLINPSVVKKHLRYQRKSKTRYLLGPTYSLASSARRPRKRKISQRVQNILVTMGGVDMKGMTPKVIKALQLHDRKLCIHVVTGQSFRESDKLRLRKLAKKFRDSIRIYQNESDLSGLMKSVDLCVNAGGMTLYELAMWGCPSLSIGAGRPQVRQARAFMRIGTTLALDFSHGFQREKFLKALKILDKNPSQRRRMMISGMRVIDGNGCSRIVDVFKTVTQKSTATGVSQTKKISFTEFSSLSCEEKSFRLSSMNKLSSKARAVMLWKGWVKGIQSNALCLKAVNGKGRLLGVLYAEPDDWCSGFFGYRVMIVKHLWGTRKSKKKLVDAYLLYCQRHRVRLNYIRLDCRARTSLETLKSAGFCIKEELVNMSLAKRDMDGRAHGICLPDIRPLKHSDLHSAGSLVGREYTTSHFHRERRIPLRHCRKLYESLIRNLIKDQSNIALGLRDGRCLIGFVICQSDRAWRGLLKKRVGFIKFIVVDRKYQGQGFAKQLLWAGLDVLWRRGADLVELNTQKNNQAALSLYNRAGFRTTQKKLTLHKWINPKKVI